MRIVDPLTLTQPSARKRVVVAGGGYAGMTLAVSLAQRKRPEDDIEVILVDPRPYQQSLAELDLVAAGTPRPQFAELWHADVFRGLDIDCVYDRLECVHPERSTLSVGPRGCPKCEIPYWRLVICTGAIPTIPPVPGLKEHATTMWSVRDAHELQNRIEAQLKEAGTMVDAEARRRALSFCVVGGGATGVEIVGTIAADVPRMMKLDGLDTSDLNVHLIEGRPDILYDLEPKQREKARRRLEKMGVDMHLGEKLVSVDGAAQLESGAQIPSPVLVWCAGARADPDAVEWGLEFDNSGRLLCDQTLKAKDCDDIYVAGDVAAFRDPKDNRVLPMLCQYAIRQAEHTTGNILREARGTTPLEEFEPHQHGEFVSVGPHWGVGWMYGLNVSGWFAIIMKRLTYVIYWLQVGTFRLAARRTRQMLMLRRI